MLHLNYGVTLTFFQVLTFGKGRREATLFSPMGYKKVTQ